jgi:hypothetical protein
VKLTLEPLGSEVLKLGNELNRLRYYLANEPTLIAYVKTRKDDRYEWENVVPGENLDLDKIRGYVVTYPSGEIVDEYMLSGTLPDGVYFMEGPTYQDDSDKYCKKMVNNEIVIITHGECLSRPDDPEYYSTTIMNNSGVGIRIYKFVGLGKLFGVFGPRDDGSGYYSPRQFIEWFRVRDKKGWIAPGESVTDPENWSGGAGIWAYFFEKENGGRFISTVPLPKN